MFTKAYPKRAGGLGDQAETQAPPALCGTFAVRPCHNDWRDMLPTIDIPALIVGGKTSLVGWRSQQWIGTQIPNSRVEIFEEAEGGNHFMFMENPEKFNRLVREIHG